MPNAIDANNTPSKENGKDMKEVTIEQRDKKELPVIQEAKEPESEKDRTPKKMHTKKKYILFQGRAEVKNLKVLCNMC